MNEEVLIRQRCLELSVGLHPQSVKSHTESTKEILDRASAFLTFMKGTN